MSKVHMNVPKLRFPEYEEEWVQKSVKDTFLFLQNNTLSRAELDTDEGCAKNIHYGDVLVKFGEYLEVSKADLPYIKTQSILEKYSSSFLQDGDIIMADTAEDETVGKCTEIAELHGDLAISGLHTIPMRPKAKFASGYLGYYMNSKAYHEQLFPLMQGIKVTAVSKSAIQGTLISYPKNPAEQDAIGKCFIQLDTLITLQQHKLDQIKEYKKGMLQKMFPKEGESVPEVRFPGFDGEWELHKLGEITDSYSGGTPTAGKAEYYGGDIPFIRSAEINSDSTELFLTEEGLKNSSAKMINKGDVLYALYGATSGETGIARLDGAINQAILDIKPHENFDAQFIMQWLRKSKERIIGTFLQGGQGNLSGTIVTSLIIKCPDYEEQQKIGIFLRNIDDIITLHQRKLEAMKEYKKGLLQRMFV